MTKTTTVPHLLEQLSVELHANGVKLDTCTAYGVHVRVKVRFEPVSERHDEPHVVIENIVPIANTALFGTNNCLDLWSGSDVLMYLSKSQVAAIEENLLAQMAGE